MAHETFTSSEESTHEQIQGENALGTLPEDGNVMPKHVGPTIHN
jgi:hypothetical protein